MAQSETRDARSGSAKQNLPPTDFLGFGAMGVETMMQAQKELLDTFEQLNRERLGRAQQETELAAKFAGKMTSARSVPDVMTAYQEWAAKRMEMFAEDSRKLFDDSYKVFNATTRLFPNGRGGGST
jgi:Phasin protein